MKKELREYEKIALSDKNMFNLLDGNCKLVLYPDLINYNTIDEVLDNKPVILLFEAKKEYGHWCGLWKINNTIYFFNSYGGYPDDSLDYIPLHFARMNNEDKPYLSILLEKSPYDLDYNKHRYQEKNSNIKTCGRHVAVRLWCKNMTDDEYYDYIKEFTKKYNINADEMVTLLTMNITKK